MKKEDLKIGMKFSDGDTIVEITNIAKSVVKYNSYDVITNEFLGSNKNTINTFLDAINSDLELIGWFFLGGYIEIKIKEKESKIVWINKHINLGKDNFIDSISKEIDKQLLKESLEYAIEKGYIKE